MSIVLIMCCAFSFSACSEDAAPLITTEETVSYAELKARVDAFDDVYVYYCYNKQDELKVFNGEGFSPLGTACEYTYITNTEGMNPANTLRSCKLQIVYDDGSFNVDEYFAVDASLLFIARTSVPADGALGTVIKYLSVDGVLYEINEAESTLTLVEKADTLDLYLSFSELAELYGNEG